MHKSIFMLGLIILFLGGAFTFFTYETTFVESYEVEVEKERIVPYQVQFSTTQQVPYEMIEDKEETLLELDVFSIYAGDIYLEYVYIPAGRDVVVSFEFNDTLNLWILTYDEWDEFMKSGYTKEPENPLVKKTGVKKAEVGFHTSIPNPYVFVLKNQNSLKTVSVYYAKFLVTWQEIVTKYRIENYNETEIRLKTETYYENEIRQRKVTKYISEKIFKAILLQSEANIMFTIISITGLVITIMGYITISNQRPHKITHKNKVNSNNRLINRLDLKTNESDIIKYAKIELEKERINEILKTLKEKFDKGKIEEDIYIRLKIKYENEIKKLE